MVSSNLIGSERQVDGTRHDPLPGAFRATCYSASMEVRHSVCALDCPDACSLLVDMDRGFFHRLGASRLDRTICSATGTAALTATLGLRYGTEPEQFRDSKLILAWGANIHGTNIHLWPFIV